RPIHEPGAGHTAQHARLVEVARTQPPEISGEVRVAAADQPAVNERLLLLRLVARRGPERLRLGRRVVRQLALHERAELVVVELGFGEPRPLLENDHRKARCRELLGNDAARGTRPDDDEVDDLSWLETRAGLRLDHDRGSDAARLVFTPSG